jgi:hemoglobin-like flavoprotein
MTSEQLELLKHSWEQVKPKSAQFAEVFYYRLFDLDPHYRSLFKGSLYEQKQKFVQMLDGVIRHMDRREILLPGIKEYGKRDASYSSRLQDYVPVGEALMFALQSAIGEEWTAEHETVWYLAYCVLSTQIMKHG